MAGLAPALAEGSCDKRDSLNQMELNICAGKDFDAADKTLNASYAQIMARLKGDDAARALLQKAQRGWIAFRDAECEFQTASTAQGSIHPLLLANCWTALTQKRTAELKAYLNCEEGDLNCPVPQGQQ